ncbi:N-acetylmuramoyl-L-alanine amidase [Peribacillus loiseleuriae]|uniref:MurNAc-LAA domain-containing protein n=1 Tax=Peribacillus loiseleuriae TaxID=1679170 RepID=A0A0K9GSP3_9BACI|nr:N-acetylmuramoyl-L-alanine amidase [Peribacillus loiseleuriae]KMY49655.1 hypothetical protein AC625_08985 [Peribacillus loiseleuriae]
MKKSKLIQVTVGKIQVGEPMDCKKKTIVLDISKEIKKYLDENYMDHETTLTKSTEVNLELFERTDIANRGGTDVNLSQIM